jgi:carboxypeptidase Q
MSILCLGLCLGPLLLGAVVQGSPAPPADPRRAAIGAVDAIVDEALARGEAWRMLEELCTRAPHRLSGSEGAERAIEWARERMIADKLEYVRLEPCLVPRWERGEMAELTVLAPPSVEGTRIPILALGGSEPTPSEGIEAGLVVVRSFEELAALGERTRGSIVLFDRPMDPKAHDPFAAYGGAVDQRSRGGIEGARAGALAALVRSMTLRRDDHPHTGMMLNQEGVPRIPAAAVSTNGADHLARLALAGEPVRLRLRLDCRNLEPVLSSNVVAELRGRERPEEVVLIGAHLDARDVGEGAHDDGAGTVQAMEALRLLRELGLRPRRTVRCVLFMNEESGLAGAKAYAADHADEVEQHVFAMESDRGGFSPRGFTSPLEGAGRAELAELVALLGRTGADRLFPGGGGADIGALGRMGVPLAGLYPDPQRYFDFHHAELDRLDAVHPRELELGAAALAALGWLVAEREAPLARLPLPEARESPAKGE